MISYAKNFEGVMQNRVFKGQSIGFYNDVGTLEATMGSVTKRIYANGWSGVNIALLPENYRRIAAARPRDVNLNVANCSDPLVLYAVGDTGLSTSRADYASMHVAKGFNVSEFTVPTRTLKDICAEYAASISIDLLKADVIESMDGTCSDLASFWSKPPFLIHPSNRFPTGNPYS